MKFLTFFQVPYTWRAYTYPRAEVLVRDALIGLDLPARIAGDDLVPLLALVRDGCLMWRRFDGPGGRGRSLAPGLAGGSRRFVTNAAIVAQPQVVA